MEAVLDDLGEKPVAAFAKSVQLARSDLTEYRTAFPLWVTDASNRGLANWIHDRLMARLIVLAEDIDGMAITGNGVTREAIVGLKYRFRVKRHDEKARVASYETATFLDFVLQPTPVLPGFEEVRLIAGYEWDRELIQIGDPVITLRDGKDNVLWTARLIEGDDGIVTGTVIAPTSDSPTPATIVPTDVPQEETGSE